MLENKETFKGIKMGCSQCNQLYLLEEKSAHLYFLSEFDELIQKSKIFLTGLDYKLTQLNGLNYTKVTNIKTFFTDNLAALNTYFNKMEREDIKICLADPDKAFDFQALMLAKPLQYYINLVEDKEFFDIIQNESLTSHFQPIIQASDRSIYGYEALVRGVDPKGKLVYPDVLFAKSERNNMDFHLDRLCRETALKTAAVKNINQKVFINFIPTSIYDPEFCLKSTVKWANQLEFDYKNIVFEVVETASVKDKEHLKKVLNYYREQGFQVALDDVGEGFSNLNMIIELRPDIIKIDRNIICDIDKSELKHSVYEALYKISHDNGIEVLAEGVETQEEIDTVEAIGVDYIQGYYFSKPTAESIRKI